MATRIPARILTLAIKLINWLACDDSPILQRMSIVFVRVVNAHHDPKRVIAQWLERTVNLQFGKDDGAVANLELGAMV